MFSGVYWSISYEKIKKILLKRKKEFLLGRKTFLMPEMPAVKIIIGSVLKMLHSHLKLKDLIRSAGKASNKAFVSRSRNQVYF